MSNTLKEPLKIGDDMPKQMICPLAFPRNASQFCLEENCGWWLPKGMIDKKTEGVDKSMTIYSPEGCYAVKAIGLKLLA